LTNEERVEIGILYKETGPQAARRRGLELTAARLPAIMADVERAAAGRPIVVYCWRGGLRSKTVATVLDLTGLPVRQLIGGYKTFRSIVTATFEQFTPPGPLIVLHGLTGIGKTTFLGNLQSSGATIIDLEGLACHRGSAFGSLGLSQELTQKRFETLLWDAFRHCPAGRPIFIEGESRRIGRIFLPGNLYEVMQKSIKIWNEASLETRVERLLVEYGREEYRDLMAEALIRIKKKLGGEQYAEMVGHLERWELKQLTAGLINHYYDRLYYRERPWVEDLRLSLEDFDSARQELFSFLGTKGLTVPS
jgi:tRNA 2-selenouridine synthase